MFRLWLFNVIYQLFLSTFIIQLVNFLFSLKKTLNIADAPVMAYGSIPVQAQPAAEVLKYKIFYSSIFKLTVSIISIIQDEEESTVKTVQTAFTLKLNKFDDSKKVALIKEVKNIVEGLNLVQVKNSLVMN